MRIHVTFIDRVGITQEVLALLGARNLNLDAVEMIPPNVYIDAPALSQAVLDELHDALVPQQQGDGHGQHGAEQNSADAWLRRRVAHD